jgi:transglutaminase-like putative cysteine protease
MRFVWKRNCATLVGLVFFLGAAAAQRAPRKRHFSFRYAVTVKDIPAGAKHVDLWVPQPHDDPYQRVTNMRVDCPYPARIAVDRHGNRIIHVGVEHPPSTGFSLVMSFDAVRKEHILRYAEAARVADPPAAELAQYLKPDRLVPLDDTIRGWARQVVNAAGAKTDLQMARAIYNNVIRTVKYDKSGKGWGRGDIYYACNARHGNCTDFHAIVIGFARAVGIPARFSIGFPLPPDRGAGQIAGYHCWAELYIKGHGWLPIDASEAAQDPSRREYFFGAHDENRVQFTSGRDLVLVPKQAGQPLNYFIYPYAEVDGTPFQGVHGTYSYRDLHPGSPETAP